MKAQIQQRARELGFDACGIAPANPPETRAQFESWLATGRQGEMAYLQRNANKRIDPQLVLPGARSIISLGVSYCTAETRSAGLLCSPLPSGEGSGVRGTSIRGEVARYARFTDYHDVIAERLKRLAGFVDQLGGGGTRSLWYIDTGPFLERDIAQRAGIGFIGKHTNLISRQLGNWIFLAEIISTVELEPDRPERNRCGSCARCLAACPTQAITAPFELDARRCISYLTIELRGSIPVELRPAMGNRIFGCDDCLMVCPWNRFAREGNLMKAHARYELSQPDLLELISLDEGGFRRRFADTPLARAKRKGLVRNVCVALGNTGDAHALPALERAAADPEPLIQEHAAWAIEQIQSR